MIEAQVMHAADWPPGLWLKDLRSAAPRVQARALEQMLPWADRRLLQALQSGPWRLMPGKGLAPEAWPAFYALLGRIGAAESVPLLLAELREAEPARQTLILQALTALGQTRAALPVLRACQQGQLACSEAAESLLCWLLPRSAWPHVQNNHLARRLQNAWAAGLAPDQMPGLPPAPVWQAEDPRSDVQLETLVVEAQGDTWLQAARSLCRRAGSRYPFLYRSCLQQPDAELRALALQALARCQRLQLADIAWLMQDVSPRVRLAALTALPGVKAASMARWKLLKQALQDPARPVQHQALQLLLQYRLRAAEPGLIARLPEAPITELPVMLGYLQALPTAAGLEALQNNRQYCPGWLWPVWQNAQYLLTNQLTPITPERKPV